MKLNVERVSVKNFGSFGKKEQEWILPNGVVSITGMNEETGRSNGSGKSSLTESLVWGLWGRTIKGLVKSGIVNWKNGKGCVVQVWFKKDDDQYLLKRGIKPDKLELYKNDERVEAEKSRTDFQKWIEENVFEQDWNTFSSLFVCNPNSFVSIFDSTKAQKRALLENPFNLKKYSEIQKSCNDKINEYSSKKDQVVGRLEGNKESFHDLEEQVKGFKQDRDKIRIDRSRLENLEKKILEQEEEEISIDDKIEEIEEKERKYTRYKNKTNQTLSGIVGSVQIVKSKLQYIGLEESGILSDEEYEEINRFIQENKKESLEKELEEEEQRAFSLSTQKASLEKERAELEKSESIGDDQDTCPVCFSRIDPNRVKEQKEEKLSQIKDKINKIQDPLKNVYEKIEDIKSRLKKLEEEKEKLSLHNNEMSKRQKYTRLEKALGCLQRTEKEYEKVLDEREDYLEKIEKIKKTLQKKKAEQSVNIYEEKKAEEQRIRELEEQREMFNRYIDNANKKKARLEQKISEDRKNRDLYSNILEYYKFIRVLCKDENVKQYAISNLVPVLNKKVNYYLSQAGVGFWVKLDGWLEAEIHGPGVRNANDKNLSSGEKKSLELATQFALFDITSAKAKNTFNFLILDEILDSSVDPQGVNNLLNIIRVKQEEQDLCVLIISHRKEGEVFTPDGSIVILKNNGFSRLKQD